MLALCLSTPHPSIRLGDLWKILPLDEREYDIDVLAPGFTISETAQLGSLGECLSCGVEENWHTNSLYQDHLAVSAAHVVMP